MKRYRNWAAPAVLMPAISIPTLAGAAPVTIDGRGFSGAFNATAVGSWHGDQVFVDSYLRNSSGVSELRVLPPFSAAYEEIAQFLSAIHSWTDTDDGASNDLQKRLHHFTTVNN